MTTVIYNNNVSIGFAAIIARKVGRSLVGVGRRSLVTALLEPALTAASSRSPCHATPSLLSCQARHHHHQNPSTHRPRRPPSWVPTTTLWVQSTSSPSQHRLYSNSNSDTTKTTTTTTGTDHHALFQEQLQELEEERHLLFGMEDPDISSDKKSTALSDVGNDMMMQQQSRIGDAEAEQLIHELEFHDLEDLVNVDDGGQESASASTIAANNVDADVDAEELKQERELLFQFTLQEREAWTASGHVKSSLSQQQSLQQVLTEVARLRAEIGSDGDSSSSSFSSSSSDDDNNENDEDDFSKTFVPQQPLDNQHHESFSHVSPDGTSIHMVDVGDKAVTTRTATARTKVWLPPNVMAAFSFLKNGDGDGNNTNKATGTQELVGPKGPIFATAKLAGIMAAKKTSDLIPLCHPLPLDQVQVRIQLDPDHQNGTGTITIDCTCRVTHKTGVEMEALTGATVAALTIYDMTKAVSHDVIIGDTRLISKKGGKRTVRGDEKRNA